jgi:phosphoethanolamine N-methyltransferase
LGSAIPSILIKHDVYNNMSEIESSEYNDELLDYLQLFRGEGFLSPGGAEETRQVLDRLDVAGKDVLEVGSGLGGCCLIIAREHEARQVHGLDVEPIVIDRAKRLVAQAGLQDQITFQLVQPGPLPVPADTYDVVFSKDACCHIEDKLGLYSELFRVLRPGGSIAIGDWMVRDEEGHSSAMEAFIKSTGLSLFLDSLTGVRRKLETVGFEEIDVVDRNAWFQQEARAEAARLEGELAGAVVKLRGQDATDSSNECQHKMIAVLDSGEFCPAHFFATKPG